MSLAVDKAHNPEQRRDELMYQRTRLVVDSQNVDLTNIHSYYGPEQHAEVEHSDKSVSTFSMPLLTTTNLQYPSSAVTSVPPLYQTGIHHVIRGWRNTLRRDLDNRSPRHATKRKPQSHDTDTTNPQRPRAIIKRTKAPQAHPRVGFDSAREETEMAKGLDSKEETSSDHFDDVGCPMPKMSEIGGPVLEIWQGVGEEEGYMQDIQEWAVNTKEKAGGGDDLAGELSGTSIRGTHSILIWVTGCSPDKEKVAGAPGKRRKCGENAATGRRQLM
ncbi:hypothetical protein BJ912DRAFT_1106874 [Pholiota molesta]|nr:hypothetical protein BJ912DRAFT_1106874 [Pholiota molesta]